jgi:hypothetical protein
MIAKLIQVKAVDQYLIWLKYDDNTEGQVDLTHLKDKPVFKKWENSEFFNKVYIDAETQAVAWDENIELCPDSLYLKIKRQSFQQWKTNQYSHAAG